MISSQVYDGFGPSWWPATCYRLIQLEILDFWFWIENFDNFHTKTYTVTVIVSFILTHETEVEFQFRIQTHSKPLEQSHYDAIFEFWMGPLQKWFKVFMYASYPPMYTACYIYWFELTFRPSTKISVKCRFHSDQEAKTLKYFHWVINITEK